jgi:hypothetical protein
LASPHTLEQYGVRYRRVARRQRWDWLQLEGGALHFHFHP